MFSVQSAHAGADAGAARPLPPGWHQHWDSQRQIWYYVNTNVVPPQVSYVHPSGIAVQTKAKTESGPSGGLSAAQKLYASAGKTSAPPAISTSPATFKPQTATPPPPPSVSSNTPPPPSYDHGIPTPPPSTVTSPQLPSTRYSQQSTPLIPPPSSFNTSPVQQSPSNAEQHSPTDFYHSSVISQRNPGLSNRASTIGGRPSAAQSLYTSSGATGRVPGPRRQSAASPATISTSNRISTNLQSLHGRSATSPAEAQSPVVTSPSYQGPSMSKPKTTPMFEMTARPPTNGTPAAPVLTTPAFQPGAGAPPPVPPPPPLPLPQSAQVAHQAVAPPPPPPPLVQPQQTGSSTVSSPTGYTFPTQSFNVPAAVQPQAPQALPPVTVMSPPPPPPVQIVQSQSTGSQVVASPTVMTPATAAPAQTQTQAQTTTAPAQSNNGSSTASSVGKNALKIVGAVTVTALTGIPAGAVIGLGSAVGSAMKKKKNSAQQQQQAQAGAVQAQVQAQTGANVNQLTNAMAGVSLNHTAPQAQAHLGTQFMVGGNPYAQPQVAQAQAQYHPHQPHHAQTYPIPNYPTTTAYSQPHIQPQRPPIPQHHNTLPLRPNYQQQQAQQPPRPPPAQAQAAGPSVFQAQQQQQEQPGFMQQFSSVMQNAMQSYQHQQDINNMLAQGQPQGAGAGPGANISTPQYTYDPSLLYTTPAPAPAPVDPVGYTSVPAYDPTAYSSSTYYDPTAGTGTGTFDPTAYAGGDPTGDIVASAGDSGGGGALDGLFSSIGQALGGLGGGGDGSGLTGGIDFGAMAESFGSFDASAFEC
ncbi:hypothetical protein AX16_001820 [Volvariella volvacea WC 439]|nr:hypothetical protein AX16_001820 [Volvariella volvacea WC 439]